METQAKSLDRRRAECRIWAHMLFWWLVPFGWIISTSKMRYGVPVYVMIGAMCLGVVTTPSQSGLDPEQAWVEGFVNGQKYGFVGSVIGSAITVGKIHESRQKGKPKAST